MKPLFTGIFAFLCIALLLGIAGSTIAATVEIETIVGTGPIFSLVGVATALGILKSRSPANLLFGLSVPIFSVCIFFLIFTRGWSPQQASVPVSSIILGYEAFAIPLGLWALFRTVRPATAAGNSARRPWQFNLRSLFFLILISSISLGAARSFMQFGTNLRLSIAIVACLLTAVLIGLTYWGALRLHAPVQEFAKGVPAAFAAGQSSAIMEHPFAKPPPLLHASPQVSPLPLDAAGDLRVCGDGGADQ